MTIQPRKERKALFALPRHRRGRQMTAHLSEELLVKYGKRSVTLRKGDMVRVMRGSHKGTSGKIVEVDARNYRVTVDGVTAAKADGTQKPKPIHPSNLVVTKIDITDRMRRAKLGAVLTADELAAAEREREDRKKADEAAKKAKEEAAEEVEEEGEEVEEKGEGPEEDKPRDEAGEAPPRAPPSEMEEEHTEEEER